MHQFTTSTPAKNPVKGHENCKSCKGHGRLEWFDNDGMTIYSWQKPKSKPCPHGTQSKGTS